MVQTAYLGSTAFSNIAVGSTTVSAVYVGSTKIWEAGSSWTNPDIANASYDNISFDVSGKSNFPAGLSFSADGTKMFFTGSGQVLAYPAVFEYSLSTAWDITSASYNQDFDVSSQVTSNQGVTFSSDGTKFYIPCQSNDKIFQYNLSSAYDVSTASYSSKSLDISSQEAQPREVFFKPDGSKVFVVGSNGDEVNEYSLSTAWDISSGSFVQNFSVASQDASPSGLSFAPDGSKMYVIGVSTDSIYQYSLSTNWDISSASYDSISFSVQSQDGYPAQLFFKYDGSKMYVIGVSADLIYQYST